MTTTNQQASSDHQLRFELQTTDTGLGTGVWRPYSRDLAEQLPELLAVLAPDLGPIHRVIYHLDDWATAPARLDFGGRRVRLDGYRYMPAHAVEVLGVNGVRLAIQIVTEP